jgi:hypothetical protein
VVFVGFFVGLGLGGLVVFFGCVFVVVVGVVGGGFVGLLVFLVVVLLWVFVLGVFLVGVFLGGCFLERQAYEEIQHKDKYQSGFHYRIHTDASGNYYNDAVYQPDYTLLPIIASNDSSQCYGAESSTLQLEKGMKVAPVISFGDYWAGSCKPSVSLFYYPSRGGDRRVCETSYVWKSSCWGVGTNGKPDKGYKSVNASVVGCKCDLDHASVRSVVGDPAAVLSSYSYCGGSALINIKIGAQS